MFQVSSFGFIGHIYLVSFLVYFTLSFSSTFHLGHCKLFYAHSCVCNFIIFSECVQQCVMTACVMTAWPTMCYHIQFDFLHLFSWIQVIGVRG